MFVIEECCSKANRLFGHEYTRNNANQKAVVLFGWSALQKPRYTRYAATKSKRFLAEVIEFKGFASVISIMLCVAACSGLEPLL